MAYGRQNPAATPPAHHVLSKVAPASAHSRRSTSVSVMRPAHESKKASNVKKTGVRVLKRQYSCCHADGGSAGAGVCLPADAGVKGPTESAGTWRIGLASSLTNGRRLFVDHVQPVQPMLRQQMQHLCRQQEQGLTALTWRGICGASMLPQACSCSCGSTSGPATRSCRRSTGWVAQQAALSRAPGGQHTVQTDRCWDPVPLARTGGACP